MALNILLDFLFIVFIYSNIQCNTFFIVIAKHWVPGAQQRKGMHSLEDSREQQHLFDAGEGYLTTLQYDIMVGAHRRGRDCTASQEAREIQSYPTLPC